MGAKTSSIDDSWPTLRAQTPTCTRTDSPIHKHAHKHTQVWDNLLKAAGIENLDVAELGTHELNGRQIKTTIRLAQALALHEGCGVEQRHVASTLAVARQFSDDLSSAQDFV